MNVSLTPHFEKFVENMVGTGKYQTASEVMRDALRLLQEKEEAMVQKKETLRALIAEGLNSGDAEELDIDNFLAEARERYNTRSGKGS